MAKAKQKSAPAGYRHVIPYLRVRGAADAMKFYIAAFGAKEHYHLTMAGGRIGHAEMAIGDAVIMLSDEFPDHGATGPASLKGTTVALALYVTDVDAVVAKAVAAGAKIRRPVEDQFYGDRTGQIEDPFGHVWSIQTRIEEVAPKEMQKRLDAMMATPAPAPPPAKRRKT